MNPKFAHVVKLPNTVYFNTHFKHFMNAADVPRNLYIALKGNYPLIYVFTFQIQMLSSSQVLHLHIMSDEHALNFDLRSLLKSLLLKSKHYTISIHMTYACHHFKRAGQLSHLLNEWHIPTLKLKKTPNCF